MLLLPILVFLILMLLLIVALNGAYRAAVSVQEEDIRDLVALGRSSIEQFWVSPRNEAVTRLSTTDLLKRRLAGEAPLSRLLDEWRGAQLSLEDNFFVYYGLEDGTVELYPELTLPDGFDPRVRPWYRAAMEAESDDPVWTAPYTEVITGETIVSTAVRLRDGDGRAIGVFAADVTLNGVKNILDGIRLPGGGSVFLLDEAGHPLIGTDTGYLEMEELPPPGERLFVEKSSPLSNGWRVAVVVPRRSVGREFAVLRKAILAGALALFLAAAALLTAIAAQQVSRTGRLADYFREAVEERGELRLLFRGQDEFTLLNRQFNRVIRAARGAEEEKLARERGFRYLLERAPIGFFRSTRAGELRYVNNHLCILLGYSRNELLGLPSALSLYEKKEDRERLIRRVAESGEIRGELVRMVRRNGVRIWCSVTFLPVADEDGGGSGERAEHYEGFIVDASREVEERDTLRRLAETDPLTQLANRRTFEERLESAVAEARERGTGLSLIVFDIDRFKWYNDSYGHGLGDSILRMIAAAGESVLRKNDIFARLGGDEFAVLLPDAPPATARILADRLERAVNDLELADTAAPFPSISCGISGGSGEELSAEGLIARADQAMYVAKKARRRDGATPPSR